MITYDVSCSENSRLNPSISPNPKNTALRNSTFSLFKDTRKKTTYAKLIHRILGGSMTSHD